MSLYLALDGTTKQAFGIKDTNASHYLKFVPGSDLTADRSLTLVTGDAARTITLSGNPTLADWFDQAVKTTSDSNFASLTATLLIGRGAAGGAFTVQNSTSNPAANTFLGSITAQKSNAGAWEDSAAIKFNVDAATGANDSPGRISFWTTPDGSATLAERVRITSAGKLLFDGGAGLAHGVTDYGALTSSFLIIDTYGADGGAVLRGYSDNASIPGLYLMGMIGVTDPTDTVSAVTLVGCKKSGTAGGALGAAETVLGVYNFGTNLITVLGNGNVGINIVNPSIAKLEVFGGLGNAAAQFTGQVNFIGTNTNSHFNYSTSEAIYIRGGKTGAYVWINDAHNGPVSIAAGGGGVSLCEVGTGTVGIRVGSTSNVALYIKSTSTYGIYVLDSGGSVYNFYVSDAGAGYFRGTLALGGALTVGGSVRLGVDQVTKYGFYRFQTSDSGSLHYIHFKTNMQCVAGYYQMMTVRYSGHDYAGPAIINVMFAWYSNNGAITNPIGAGSHAVSAYKSSDNYIVLTLRLTEIYYCGVVLDCLGPGPQGFFDLLITAASHSASATGQY